MNFHNKIRTKKQHITLITCLKRYAKQRLFNVVLCIPLFQCLRQSYDTRSVSERRDIPSSVRKPDVYISGLTLANLTDNRRAGRQMTEVTYLIDAIGLLGKF